MNFIRNRIKQKLIIFILVINIYEVIAQGNGADPNSSVPKLIPPSPNAAAIEKFGTIPVDYSTGIPSISYPMYAWQRGRLQFNLGLVYHAGGHKVEDMASNVGLGWALNGPGRISRTVRGVPDDKANYGFLYTPVIPQIVTANYDGDYHNISFDASFLQAMSTDDAINDYNSPYASLIKSITEGYYDGEQDIFSYSINGASGRFIFDKNRNIVPLEHTNLKLEATYASYQGSNPTGIIIAFQITDDKGIIYKFSYTENQNSQTISTSQGIEANVQDYVSGWLLTEIFDPTVNDKITINYASNSNVSFTQYETSFSESETYDMDILLGSGQGVIGKITPASDIYSFSSISGNDPRPSSVNFPDGSLVSLEYNIDRQDLVNGKALSKVIIKNSYNDVVKQFGFDYSYFISPGSPIYIPNAPSGNDFGKRLKLDRADEISNDGLAAKPTSFVYNSLPLNPRGANEIDYWGYNVNPSRNNTNYVPRIPLEQKEILIDNNYGLYLSGADRKPDGIYVKAALLEKIIYPTGGSTSFEYEANMAFSEINYYEDKLQSNTVEWLQSDFGQTRNINFASREKTDIEFFFKTEEFDPRPVPVPGEPQSCLEGLQDNMLVRFEITSTDNSFSTYVESSYIDFLNGYKKVISLPLNKNYRIKFIYDLTAVCSFMYPFKATCYGTYYIPLQDKLAGGVRIRKITSEDGLGGTLVKEYEYSRPDGHSSATLNTIPNFGYYRSTSLHHVPPPGSTLYDIRHITRTSNPTSTLNYHNSAPIIYSRVIEKEVNGSQTEMEYDPVVYAEGGFASRYPYMPGQDFPNLSGLLMKQTIKDKFGIKKKETIITYNKVQNYLVTQPEHRNIKTGTIATSANSPNKLYISDHFFMYTSRAEEISNTTNTFENGNVLTEAVTKTYHPSKYYLGTITTTNSKNEQIQDQLFYVFDEIGTVYNTMIANNMLNFPSKIISGKLNTLNGELKRMHTNYQLWQNNMLPKPVTVQSSFAGATLATDITFNDYDNKGNVLQYTAKDGVINSFIWGYNQQYPVAKIVGKSYNDAVTQSGITLSIVNAPSDDIALRTELNKLRTVTGAFVTTYTYKPLVGITSETDPRGKTIFYDYDAFNRLILVRDQDNNIIKKLDYKYQATTQQ